MGLCLPLKAGHPGSALPQQQRAANYLGATTMRASFMASGVTFSVETMVKGCVDPPAVVLSEAFSVALTESGNEYMAPVAGSTARKPITPPNRRLPMYQPLTVLTMSRCPSS